MPPRNFWSLSSSASNSAFSSASLEVLLALFTSAVGAAASGIAVQAESKTHVINEKNRCFSRWFGWRRVDGFTNRFCGKVTRAQNESLLTV
jgi:hypothetical protein